MKEGNNIFKKADCEKAGAKSVALHINIAVTIVCAYALWGGLHGISLGFSNAWEYGLLGVVGLYGALYRWLSYIEL
jgi:hypothetical protein